MAVAGLNEIIQSYIRRRNSINLDLTNYSTQKTLSSARQSDLAGWKNNRTQALRSQYKTIFSTEYKGQTIDGKIYTDYTELAEYQDEVSYVESYYDARIEDLTAWETQLDNQITTINVELNEINAYIDSFKQMMSNNVKNDYNYGLNT